MNRESVNSVGVLEGLLLIRAPAMALNVTEWGPVSDTIVDAPWV